MECDWRSRLIAEFCGREVYMCHDAAGERLNLDINSVSFCHEVELVIIPTEVSRICSLEDLSVNTFYRGVYKALCAMQNENFPCRQCSKCERKIFSFKPVRYITVNPILYCNSSCIYCSAHSNDKSLISNQLPLLKKLHEAGIFAMDACFDYGGGEPTQHPDFEETVAFLARHGYRQRINTNAIIFSPAVERALVEGKACLRISVDSGTEQGMYIVKGHRNYHEVWNNIARYSTVSDEIYIKYNIFNYNSGKDELDGFLTQCSKANIKHILIDAEISCYQKEKNAGPFYWRRQEFDGAHYLYHKAKDLGFAVEISTYAFSVRARYDEWHQLLLPDIFYDTLDHEAVSRGIFVEAFATVEQLLERILTERSAEIAVFGYGGWGKNVARILETAGFDFHIVDNDCSKSGMTFGKRNVELAAEFLATAKEVVCILCVAQRHISSMLKQINDAKCRAKAYWCSGISYKNYLSTQQED